MVSVPTASNPGDSENVKVPFARLLAAEMNVPLLNCTVPVGVPLAPVTVTVTVVPWALVKLEGDAETVTVAIAVPVADAAKEFTTLATFSEPSPVASS